jgi:biopolymer transport protein ExbB/TolQ
MEVSLFILWQDAGWFARGIIILLGFMSIISLGIGAQKWWRFRKARRATANFAPEFARFLQEEQLDQAIELADSAKESHVARVLGEALAEVKPLLRDRATITSADINSAERAIERQMLIILSELKRGLAVLATTGATAPFVGLLGAIPAVWLYNYFQTKVENMTVEMTYTSKELVDFLIKSVGSEFGRSIFTKEFQAQQAASSQHVSQ